MNNAIDPIKILVCGGYEVGKTSLVRRLAGMQFPRDYTQTTGINHVEFVCVLKNNASVKINLIDVGADLIHSQMDSSFFPVLLMDVDAVLIVFDSTSLQSLKESDEWLDFLSKSTVKPTFKYLLVHKADLPSENRVITALNLDRFVKNMHINGWSFTVGHPDLSDCCVNNNRGALSQQRAPEDILRKLILRVLTSRQSNIYKVLPVPLAVEFKSWATYDYEDLEKYINAYVL